MRVSGAGVTQLAPQDAEFVYSESSRHRSNIVVVYLFDTSAEAAPLTEPEAVAWMRERLGHAGMFTRRLRRVPLDFDLPYWAPDPRMNLRDHVHVSRTEAPGWDPLRRQISRIADAPIDLTRPPWELHFITGVTTGERDLHCDPTAPEESDRMTAAVLKFHHSAGDGIATRDLGRRLFGPDTAHPPVPTRLRDWSTTTAVMRALASLPLQCLRFRRGLVAAGAADERIRAEVTDGTIVEPALSRPSCRFNRPISAELTFDLVILPGDQIRAAQAAADGATVNDVMLATISGALRTYLAEQGESPGGSLAAMVPMSLRGTGKGVADGPEGPRATHLALMAVDLHTDIGDPLERLRAIGASVRLEKVRSRNEHVRRSARRIESSPALLLRLAGRAKALKNHSGPTVERYNTMISNVPWAGDDLLLRSAPLVRTFGILEILDGSGLRHLIVSSRGDGVAVSFSTDAAMMPDTDRYRDLLRDSLRDLAERAREVCI
ncbi:wax ester/triacylglycerol synthase domain-containing protein [Rhodococcus oryzae]|uniref:wax ester/triacylglycerol synthase domain-containing protein n=1 Tax=Rhodococcus oryzae TaxID=2571143 RepID=UPI00371CD2CE